MTTEYGSRNTEEEDELIRRIVAPHRRSEKDKARRRQKRAVAVGAFMTLLAGGAVCTYVAMKQQGTTLAPSQLASSSARFVIPEDEEDTGGGEDMVTPLFSDYDINGDGVITLKEYIKRVELDHVTAMGKVQDDDLSPAQTADLTQRLQWNFGNETSCVSRLVAHNKIRGGIDQDSFPLFYHMIQEFCVQKIEWILPPKYRPIEPALDMSGPTTDATPPEPEALHSYNEPPHVEEVVNYPPPPASEPYLLPSPVDQGTGIEDTYTPPSVVDQAPAPVDYYTPPSVVDQATDYNQPPSAVKDLYPTVPGVQTAPEQVQDLYPTIPGIQPAPETVEDLNPTIPGIQPAPETVEDLYPTIPGIQPAPETVEDLYPTIPGIQPAPEQVQDLYPTIPGVQPAPETVEDLYPTIPGIQPAPEDVVPKWEKEHVQDTSSTVTSTSDQLYMTKPQFRNRIAEHFEMLTTALALELKKAKELNTLLDDCITKASEQFGHYGAYEQDEYFTQAINWVTSTCLAH